MFLFCLGEAIAGLLIAERTVEKGTPHPRIGRHAKRMAVFQRRTWPACALARTPESNSVNAKADTADSSIGGALAPDRQRRCDLRFSS